MSSHAAEPFSKEIAEVVDFARALGVDVREEHAELHLEHVRRNVAPFLRS